MCEYCEKLHKPIVTHASGVSAFIGAGYLFLRFYDKARDQTILNGAAINFCPVCGRKLNEVKNG